MYNIILGLDTYLSLLNTVTSSCLFGFLLSVLIMVWVHFDMQTCSLLVFPVFKNLSSSFLWRFWFFSFLSSAVIFSIFIIILTCSHAFKELEKWNELYLFIKKKSITINVKIAMNRYHTFKPVTSRALQTGI